MFADEQTIVVVSCETGERVREFAMASTIKVLSNIFFVNGRSAKDDKNIKMTCRTLAEGLC